MLEIQLTHWPYLRWKRESMSTKAVGGIALTITIISGSTFNAYGKELTIAFSALSLLFVSELLTAFFVLFTFGVFPVLRSLRHLHRKEALWLIITGFFNGVAGPFLLFAGLALTSAVNTGFFSNMQMVFIVVLGAWILRQRILGVHYAAMVTIVAGMLVISLHGFTDGLTLQIGDTLVIASAFGYALGSIYYRKHLSHIEPHVALFMRSMVAIATFFAISPFLQHPFITEVMHFPPALIPALIGFGFIARFLSSVTYYEAIEKIDLTTVSLVGSLGIVGSTLFSCVYLGEPILWYHYVGGAFIVLGSCLLELIGSHPNEEQLALHMKQRLP